MRTATAGERRPCPSIISSTSGPTASRTARTFAAAMSTYRRPARIGVASNGVNLSALNPFATRPAADAARSSGDSPRGPLAYARILSRTSPPIMRQIGTPSACPLMSHSATSIPDNALRNVTPPMPEKRGGMPVARCARSENGSAPIKSGFRSSIMPMTARVCRQERLRPARSRRGRCR